MVLLRPARYLGGNSGYPKRHRNCEHTAQHDRVVASYTLLAAVGRLSMQRLGLNVMIYDPQVHYQQVRDAWIGVRTPDGR